MAIILIMSGVTAPQIAASQHHSITRSRSLPAVGEVSYNESNYNPFSPRHTHTHTRHVGTVGYGLPWDVTLERRNWYAVGLAVEVEVNQTKSTGRAGEQGSWDIKAQPTAAGPFPEI